MIDWKVLTVAKQLKDDVSGSLSLGSEEIVGVIVGETDEDYLVSFVVDEDGQGPVGLKLAKASVIAQVALDSHDWGSDSGPSKLTLEGDGSAVVPAGSPLEAAAGGVKNYETFVEILAESDEEYEVAPRVPLGLQVRRKKILKTSVVEAVEAAALAFNPIPALFSNGEVGAWYDPSDSTTVFQIVNNSTPATVGDPVGWLFDKSKRQSWVDASGLVWTQTSGDGVVSVVGNQITITGATTLTRVTRTAGSIPFENGAAKMTFQADYTSATSILVYLRGTIAGSNPTSGVEYTAQANLKNSTLESVQVGSGTATFTISSLQYWEGNHATQTTSAARPVLQQSGDLYYLDFDGVDDFIDSTFASAQAQPNTLSAAFKHDSIVGIRTVFDNIVSGQRHILRSNSSSYYEMYGGVFLNGGTPTVGDRVAVAHFDSTSSSSRFEGAVAVSGSAGTLTWPSIRMGASTGPNYFLDGRIYSFVGVNRTLDPDELVSVERYLGTKSGFTAPVLTGVPTIS